MKLEKEKYNIYLVTAIISIGLIFMGVSTYLIINNVHGKTSVELHAEELKKAKELTKP